MEKMSMVIHNIIVEPVVLEVYLSPGALYGGI